MTPMPLPPPPEQPPNHSTFDQRSRPTGAPRLDAPDLKRSFPAWKKATLGTIAGIAAIVFVATATFLVLEHLNGNENEAIASGQPPAISGKCADLFPESPDLYPELYRATTQEFTVAICEGNPESPMADATLIIGNDNDGYDVYEASGPYSHGDDFYLYRADNRQGHSMLEMGSDYRHYEVDPHSLTISDRDEEILEDQPWLSGNMDSLTE